MTVTTDVSIKNARLDAISTIWATGGAATLRLYSGTPPTNAGTALSGNTMLAQCTPTPAAASAGAKDMLGGAKSVTAAAGAPTNTTFYRVYNNAGSLCLEQGTVGLSGASPDLVIDNVSITSGQTVNFNTFTKTEP